MGSPRPCPRAIDIASYRATPEPAYSRSQPLCWRGYRNGTGFTRCGASRSRSSPRSFSASRTSAKSSISRYRSPPWISLLDRLDVPEAQSRASTRPVDRPRVAASSAVPAPTTPAPTTRMSSSRSAIPASASARSAGPSVAVLTATSRCRSVGVGPVGPTGVTCLMRPGSHHPCTDSDRRARLQPPLTRSLWTTLRDSRPGNTA